MSADISRALLIEDEPADAGLFRQYLVDAGASELCLIHVPTLADGLASLQEQTCDVVILDLTLPDASGLDAVIRLHLAFPALPIVVLSELDDEVTAASAVREGAQDYLVKGRVDGQLVLRAIRYAVERSRAIEALQQREEHSRALVENALDMIAIIQHNGIVRYSSPSYERIFGWRPDEMAGADWKSFIHPEDRLAAAGALEDGGDQLSFESRFRHKDGSWRVVESSVRDLSRVGGVRGIVVNSRDVTERRNFEERLRSANQTLRAVVQASPLAIYSVNMDCTVRTWNPAAGKMFGWAEWEVIGRQMPQITATGEPSVADRLERAKRGHVASGLEMRCIRRDGSTLVVNVWSELLRGSAGEVAGLVDIMADVTERRMLEQQVRQAQKMDAIARLASGVAHDFNNLLTVITGYTHLLLGTVLPGDPVRPELEQVARAADRAGELTRQLLAFSRRQLVRSRVFDVAALMGEVEPMLRRVLGAEIELGIVVQPGVWNVRADPGQIEQVLLNLALNARDAMPDGGTIAIGVANDAPGEEACALSGLRPGRYVRLSVADTGTGMSPEVQAHLFEPFFTTKAPGKGTGLGLSTSYGIIRQNDGNIRVASELGQGTEFTIWLPVAFEGALEQTPVAARGIATAGSQTILIAEDEPDVRAVIQAMLTRAGYTVLACATPEDALGLAQAHDGDIHLLISELMLPRLDGQGLASRIRASRPQIRVLYISAHTDDALGSPDGDVLEKPFTPETLVFRISEALSRPARAAAQG